MVKISSDRLLLNDTCRLSLLEEFMGRSVCHLLQCLQGSAVLTGDFNVGDSGGLRATWRASKVLSYISAYNCILLTTNV